MDILSHGLWGSIIFGRQNRRSFWIGFCFGIAPDFFSFGILLFQRLFQSIMTGTWMIRSGKPDLIEVPAYVSGLYDITHSFVVFLVVFAIVWLVLRRMGSQRPWLVLAPMFAWPFHIFLDLFTHSTSFFPTPYLWPFSYVPIDGIPWSTPIIFFTNAFFLVLLYAVYFLRKKKSPHKM